MSLTLICRYIIKGDKSQPLAIQWSFGNKDSEWRESLQAKTGKIFSLRLIQSDRKEIRQYFISIGYTDFSRRPVVQCNF